MDVPLSTPLWHQSKRIKIIYTRWYRIKETPGYGFASPQFRASNPAISWGALGRRGWINSQAAY
jgi:hypothetical protein